MSEANKLKDIDRLKEEIEQERRAIARMLDTPDGKEFVKMLRRDVVEMQRKPESADKAMQMIGEINLALRILQWG